MSEQYSSELDNLYDPEWQYIGTSVGGDSTALNELEHWLEKVNSEVDDVGNDLKQAIDDLSDVWDDNTADLFLEMLNQGRNDAFDLADNIADVAKLVGGCGTALISSQVRLDMVAGQARNDRLVVLEDGRIQSPIKIGFHVSLEHKEEMQKFNGYADDADAALKPVSDHMANFEDPKIWSEPLFKAGSLVAEETKALAVDYIEKSGGSAVVKSLEASGEQLGPRLRHASLAKRALGPAGHVISGLEAVGKIRNGNRADTVIVELGVSTTVVAIAGSLLAGVFLPFALVGVGAAVFAAPWIGEKVGDLYEQAVPEPPRSRIMRMSNGGSISESRKVDLDF